MSEIIDAIRTCGNMVKDCSECPYTNGYTDICDYICDNRSELSLMLKHHEEHDNLVAEVKAMRLVYNGVEKIALDLQSRAEKAEAEVERLREALGQMYIVSIYKWHMTEKFNVDMVVILGDEWKEKVEKAKRLACKERDGEG